MGVYWRKNYISQPFSASSPKVKKISAQFIFGMVLYILFF